MKNDSTGGTVDQVSSAIKEGNAVFYLLQVELEYSGVSMYIGQKIFFSQNELAHICPVTRARLQQPKFF